MSETDSAPKKKRVSTKLAVTAAAVVLVVGGVTALTAGVSSFNAETERLCATALQTSAKATDTAKLSVAAGVAALEAVSVTALPGGGVSTSYADRPATEGRKSGADLMAAVTKAGTTVTVEPTTKCADRDAAATIVAAAGDSSVVLSLDDAVETLTADFAAFQTAEVERLAAEAEAARIAAEAEAARVAAEQAAAAEAERLAAEAEYSYDDDTDYSSGGGSSGGGGYRGSSGTPGGGGGRVGPERDPNAPMPCWTDNGMGGLAAC